MTGLSIDIKCGCVGKHRVPLDASGHYSGPLPCDRTKHAELQIEPGQWREMCEQERERLRH